MNITCGECDEDLVEVPEAEGDIRRRNEDGTYTYFVCPKGHSKAD